MNDNTKQVITRFDDIYNLPDSRAYFNEMYNAQFENAHHASKAFMSAFKEVRRLRNLASLNVLDFASGYGIGSLLLRHDIELSEVLDRYKNAQFDLDTTAATILSDQHWLQSNRNTDLQCQIAGVDIAQRAVEYGHQVGIFDYSFGENLQDAMPSEKLTRFLKTCHLIIEVGSVAHMLPDAVEKMLNKCEELPWIITSPIRGNESQESLEVMRSAGLFVEPMPIAPFRHRLFLDEAEQQRAIEIIKSHGLNPEGIETLGSFHAQLYLARPRNECTPYSSWL